MLTKLSNSFLKISTGPVTLVCLVIFIVFSALVLPDQAAKAELYSGEIGSPDTSLYYSASKLYRMANAYGPGGRTAYIRARFSFDLVFPLVYGAFLVTAISWLIKRLSPKWDPWGRLNLLPLGGVTFDFMENIAATAVMGRYPKTTAVLDHLAGAFTLLKWITISLSFIVLICLIILTLVRTIQTKVSY